MGQGGGLSEGTRASSTPPTSAPEGERVEGVPSDPDDNIVASYPIVLVRGSDGKPLARHFIAFVRAPEGQAILQRSGFLPLTGVRNPVEPFRAHR